MSLKQWLANGWLKPHWTDAAELANLLAIVDRDMADSTSPSLSDDWKFGIRLPKHSEPLPMRVAHRVGAMRHKT